MVGKVQGGEEFHSTHAAGHAVSFLLGKSQTIQGIEIALQAMSAGISIIRISSSSSSSTRINICTGVCIALV